jgi:heptaprenyl diphosphate synthase
MRWSVKKLVTLALFTAIALTIFVVEAQIPLPLPIPGIKLGLANCITLMVLVLYGEKEAAVVLLMRILLGSLFTGTLVSMIYSLSGGILCFLMMALLNRLLKNRHLWFISLIGAVFHNFGQILAAMVVMQSKQVLVYLPFLLVSGCITGLFTGIAADRAVYVLRKIGIKNKF